MNNFLIRAFVKKIKSENMDKLDKLKEELKQWEGNVPVNNMGKWARQTKIDDLKKQIEKHMNNNNYQSNYEQYFSNDPNNDTDAYNENNMIDRFIAMVIDHDYSYQFSDDDRWYRSGTESEKRIKELLHALVTIVRVDAERLLEDCLVERDEQYVDGLTHKTIRNWFEPYVENVNNIFVKPKFD